MKAVLVACAALAAGAAGAQPAPAPPKVPETCLLDADRAVTTARKLEYGFRAKGADGKPEPLCEIEGASLIVSGAGDRDVTCQFELFVPPPPQEADAASAATQHPLRRVGVKQTGEDTAWAERPSGSAAGFTVRLKASRGTNRQHRIVHVEIGPVDGGCDADKLEAKL